jgi:hypothetical protein
MKSTNNRKNYIWTKVLPIVEREGTSIVNEYSPTYHSR